jgi:membrane-associated phospholipid phosphatase
MRGFLSLIARAPVVAALLAFAALAGPLQSEKVGDRLQVALPLLAWACAGRSGEGGEFFLRFAAMFTVAHGAKRTLGDRSPNLRPSGGGEGFPSAHSAAAALGASALVHGCLRVHPAVQAAAVISAGFVGASRIEANRHDIWQVLAGVLLGWGCDRALRRPTPLRAAVARALSRTGAVLATAARAGAARIGALRIGPRLAQLARTVGLF